MLKSDWQTKMPPCKPSGSKWRKPWTPQTSTLRISPCKNTELKEMLEVEKQGL
jgi:hypothetical protein